MLLGDASKAKKVLHWEPKVSFKQLAQMMTDADMKLAQNEKSDQGTSGINNE